VNAQNCSVVYEEVAKIAWHVQYAWVHEHTCVRSYVLLACCRACSSWHSDSHFDTL